MTEETKARFWSKVDKSSGPDGCWLWTASVNHFGHGWFWVPPRNQHAHRVSWEMANGPISPWTGFSDGVCVLHRCDNPACVNPAHLFLGSHLENIADRDAKGRQVTLRGSRNVSAKLTESQVRLILADRRLLREIASDYGVTLSLISAIRKRKSWLHVVSDEAL